MNIAGKHYDSEILPLCFPAIFKIFDVSMTLFTGLIRIF